jgi:hypothetical protein
MLPKLAELAMVVFPPVLPDAVHIGGVGKRAERQTR